MRIVLPQDPNGYIVLEEVLNPPKRLIRGEIRLTTSQWLAFISAAKQGALDQTAVISDAMIDRSTDWFLTHGVMLSDPREITRGILEAGLNISQVATRQAGRNGTVPNS